jgi:hypothetical protein
LFNHDVVKIGSTDFMDVFLDALNCFVESLAIGF